ncbi:hypothetical protein EX30DRAFT_374091 [Ascodesmis nigricans]|uniref:Rhodopsin domain-containing protein n=1 Tax=Ascodesmis nigricans TaxID=341454 RepID=A0A4S2MLZ5_9PEZI|nr:hypothetical protein EX30DRAFT_374091 [Ascodesmis nigricans]
MDHNAKLRELYPNGLPDDSKADIIQTTIWLCTALSTVAVALRFYCRGYLLRTFGLDDWFIIPAMAVNIVFHIIGVVNHNWGGGQHTWKIGLNATQEVIKWSWLNNVLYIVCLGFVKVSILFQLLRITAPQSTYRKVIIGIFVVSILFSVVSMFMNTFQCTPVNYLWKRLEDETGKKGKCMEYFTTSVTSSALTVAMDVVLWLTPMPLVYRLNLPKAQKYGLYLVFSIAGIVCGSSIGRLVVIIHTFNELDITGDFPYLITDAVLWTTAEANVGIVCACLPTFRPLLKVLLPSVFGSSVRSNSHKLSDFPTSGIGGTRSAVTGGKSIPLPSRTSRSLNHDPDYSSSTEELAAKHGVRVQMDFVVESNPRGPNEGGMWNVEPRPDQRVGG